MAPWQRSSWQSPLQLLQQQVSQLMGQGNGRGAQYGQGNGPHWGGKGGKAGGMGKGQARGKGLYQQQPSTPAGQGKSKWLCLRSACDKSKHGAMNNANRTTCFGCGMAKGYCMSPPASQTRTTAQEAVAELRSNQAQGGQAGGTPEGGGEAAAAEGKGGGKGGKGRKGTKGKGPTAEAGTATETIVVEDEFQMPVCPDLQEYLKGRAVPPETFEVRSAEQCLAEVAPKDSTQALVNAQEDVEHFQAILTNAEAAPVGTARAAKVPRAKEDLAAAKVELEKIRDKVPTVA